MINSQPPIVVQQKRGMGCFGIGCIVVLVVVLLVAGLFALGAWFLYSKASVMTSTTPAVIQTYDGGDDVYKSAEDKITAFQQAQQQNKPASIEMTADEINTVLARNPDLAKTQIRAHVTMAGDRMHLEASLPTNLFPIGVLRDRYLNGVAEFTPGFDPATKSVSMKLYRLRLGEQEIPSDQLSMMETQMNSALNQQIQRSPDAQNFLAHAQTIEVRDGKLEIQTQ